MTELLLPYLGQLGLAGIVFVLLLASAQLGLTQFFKVLAQTILKNSKYDFTGLWVLGLSLVLGGILGGVMLAQVAPALGIRAPEPWGGVLAGVVLAAVVSGLVSYQQQRTAEKALSKVDAVTAVLGQLAAQQPTPIASPLPAALPDPLPETLTPITPEEASHMTRTDWAAVVGDDAPLVQEAP
ncbi:hypothetical protein EHF33_03185 [Deinococcus psychrotolerans]|uniref:Uncharacterized protein n=1 Tax=Deinococcus psychrotolerans TaxID=2489213 RepID=A0A3G8YCE5_9DEIO|nr:hypothetical protein [Deinococcus psychrotolerans]AZI41877.1 hypothetical protein EHF33_03185 [Deinococcus psychrotolerans]